MEEAVVVVVQARMGSVRLPGKTLRMAAGKPMILHLLDRLLLSPWPIILAVPEGDGEVLGTVLEQYLYGAYGKAEEAVLRRRLFLFSGTVPAGEEDVLGRFVAALALIKTGAAKTGKRQVVRVTGDNPWISLKYLMALVRTHCEKKAVLSVCVGLPYGAGVEVLREEALVCAAMAATDASDREHVTPYLYRRYKNSTGVKRGIVSLPVERAYRAPQLRLTVDTEEDFACFERRLLHFQCEKASVSCHPPYRAVIPLQKIIAGEEKNL